MKAERFNFLHELSILDWWSRQQAISDLISRPENEYMEALQDGIRNHEDADLRNTAIEIFSALGIRAIARLGVLARDPDLEVRLFTANILSEIRERAGLPLLSALIKDSDPNVRAAAAEAVGRIGGPGAASMLSEALSDESWVAAAAVSALGDIGGEGELELLYACLGRNEHRDMAILALEKAGNRDSLRHLTPWIGRCGPGEPALTAVIRIAERENVRPRPEYFLSMVPTLIGMLDSGNPELKRHAFMALCWSGDIMGLQYIIEAVQEEDLQEYALEGLLNIGRKAVCGIVDELKSSSGRHRAAIANVLEIMGEGKALLQFAEDEDPEVRTEVALALGSLDLARAAEELRKMLADPDEEVRRAAQRSIARLHNAHGR